MLHYDSLINIYIYIYILFLFNVLTTSLKLGKGKHSMNPAIWRLGYTGVKCLKDEQSHFCKFAISSKESRTIFFA